MTEEMLKFFKEIMTKNIWKYLWIKKITFNEEKKILGIEERKITIKEVKEVLKNNKNKVVLIKEYRYDDGELLNKIVVKKSDGTIDFTNEIFYDTNKNINRIVSKTNCEKRPLIKEIKVNNNNIEEKLFMKLDKKETTIFQRFYEGKEGKGYQSNDNLKESYEIDIDRDILEIVYNDDENNIGKISYCFNDVFANLKGKFSDYKLKIKAQGDFNGEEILAINSDEEEASEKSLEEMYTLRTYQGGDLIMKKIYDNKGTIIKVEIVRNEKPIYSSEYVYE